MVIITRPSSLAQG